MEFHPLKPNGKSYERWLKREAHRTEINKNIMANQFTVETKVTFINELHLDMEGRKDLKEGKFPSTYNVKDKNMRYETDILILRCSEEFKRTFNIYLPAIVLKSIY